MFGFKDLKSWSFGSFYFIRGVDEKWIPKKRGEV